jgi:hypothetical protein
LAVSYYAVSKSELKRHLSIIFEEIVGTAINTGDTLVMPEKN